jgi:hypothetical protein
MFISITEKYKGSENCQQIIGDAHKRFKMHIVLGHLKKGLRKKVFRLSNGINQLRDGISFKD